MSTGTDRIREARSLDAEFTRGFICACVSWLEGHGRSVQVEEALRGIGFDEMDIRILDSYDRQVLKEHGFLPRKKGRK